MVKRYKIPEAPKSRKLSAVEIRLLKEIQYRLKNSIQELEKAEEAAEKAPIPYQACTSLAISFIQKSLKNIVILDSSEKRKRMNDRRQRQRRRLDRVV